jgi:hypothetical protein
MNLVTVDRATCRALEQTAKTVHLVVRADLDPRGFRPKFVVVAQQYVDQRRFHTSTARNAGNNPDRFHSYHG